MSASPRLSKIATAANWARVVLPVRASCVEVVAGVADGLTARFGEDATRERAVNEGTAVFPLSDSIYTELCKKASDRPRRDLREVMELECDEEAEQTVSEHYRPTARREQTGGWALIRHEPVTGRGLSTAVGTSDRGSHRRGWRTEPEG
jgi:hypothetical protein